MAKAIRAWILVALLAFTAVASAFMNNTPIVVLMIPIVIQMAHAFGWSASKLLIPPVLHSHSGRYVYPNRHLYQSAGGWCGAGGRVGPVWAV